MIPGRNLRPGIFYSGAANLRQISDCVMGWSPDQPTDATEGLLFSAGWFSKPIVGLMDHAQKARRRPDGRASGLVRRPTHNTVRSPAHYVAHKIWHSLRPPLAPPCGPRYKWVLRECRFRAVGTKDHDPPLSMKACDVRQMGNVFRPRGRSTGGDSGGLGNQ